MNAERLRGIVNLLLGGESKEQLQDRLAALRNDVNSLAGNPADQNIQRQTAANLANFERGVKSFEASLSPAQIKQLAEIKAYSFFTSDMVAELNNSFAKNGITPAVVQQQINSLFESRQRYLETLRHLQTSLESIGVTEEALEPGQAEMGFRLPRDLFDNNLGDFQNELKVLNGIIRTFYELNGESPPPIQVRQISTSDVLIYVLLALNVIQSLGQAIKWCNDTIKASMELKTLVDLAKAASVDADVSAALEGQVEKKITASIQAKLKAVVDQFKGPPERKQELTTSLEKSLRQLLERVANGMTVEIRLLPPPKKEDSSPEEQNLQTQFEDVKLLAQSLDFPQIPPGTPMLQITRVPDEPVKKAEEPPKKPAPPKKA